MSDNIDNVSGVTLPMAPPPPTITVTSDKESDTVAMMVKIGVAVVVGPKISPLLVAWGIPNDPILWSVVIGGLLHKIHEVAQAKTGWSWL